MKADSLYMDEEYRRRNPSYHVEDSAWKAGHIRALLDRNRVSPATVCEVGCGAGEILAELQRHLPDTVRFHGYEISPAAADLWRTRRNDRLDFTTGDFTEQTTPAFDLLLCIDVVEHVNDVPVFLRALRTRATLKLFHIPVEWSLYKVCVPGRLRVSTERYGHIHFFTRRTALQALREAGYEVLDSFYTMPGVECGRTLEARLGAWPVKAVSAMSPELAARLFGAHSLMVLAR